MNFIDSRRKFSFLTVIMLSLAAIFITTGTAITSANSAVNQKWQENESIIEDLLEGDLDTTFGTGGKVMTQIGSSKSEALAVALQPDGKFIAAGYASNGANNDFALARYNSNGSLDATFGTGGKVMTDIANAENVSLAIAIQPVDGKLVAAGSSYNGADNDFAVARYKTDGTLDETFGTGGIVSTSFGNSFEYIDAVAVQADGKIVAAGYIFNNAYFDFALARYNSNGTLDTTFGTGGRVTTDLTQLDDLVRAISLQPDGKIVAVGEANGDFGLARYNSNGTLDTTFDVDGKVVTSINLFDSAYDVVIQSDGKIVAAGEAGDGSNSDFALIRYNSDGTLDGAFGAGGKVTTSIGSSDEFASTLTLQSGGKIIVAGFSYNGANDDFALVRYNSNGTLDSSFGTGGKITTNFNASSYDYVSAATIQAGRVIVVGSTNTNFAAAAYSLGAATCSYTLSTTSATVASGGGAGEFTVTGDAGCTRTAVSNDAFVAITSGASGTGSGTIGYTIAVNTGVARTGTITVGNQTFTINQAAGKSRKRTRFF